MVGLQIGLRAGELNAKIRSRGVHRGLMRGFASVGCMVVGKTGGLDMVTRRRFGAMVGAALLPGVARAQADADFQLQFDVVAGSQGEADAALAAMVAGGRTDMIAGLILALRFNRNRQGEIMAALQRLTGADDREEWFDWMLWQEAHPEVVPHASYAAFMREMHLQIDPNFDVFLKPEYLQRDRMGIRIEEIAWGGVVKDGIPSLDNPSMIAAGDADYMRSDDLVFGVAINGDVRAYPLRIMGWHEMFNDVIGGVSVALAYCTLCGAGILYDTKVRGRANPFVFGSSGFLYRSNKLMFDRATHSLWNQFTGKPVVGRLADSGIALMQRPVVITSWKDWREANPGTVILSQDTGYRRDYGSGVVYNDYFASADLMFPALADQARQRQKDYVFGIQQFGAAKAWPLTAFARRPVINDAVGDVAVVVIGDDETRTVRAYARGALQFSRQEGALVSDDGVAWVMQEDALVAGDGRRLERVAGHVAYWFAWDGYLGDASELYAP